MATDLDIFLWLFLIYYNTILLLVNKMGCG